MAIESCPQIEHFQTMDGQPVLVEINGSQICFMVTVNIGQQEEHIYELTFDLLEDTPFLDLNEAIENAKKMRAIDIVNLYYYDEYEYPNEP